MDAIFYNCNNLESIDSTNIDTSSVTSMNHIFYGCYSLKSIKILEKFNTTKVESMRVMFFKCTSLLYLNLSSFDTTKVTDMNWMFFNCHNIKYLDIPNFSPTNLNEIIEMFYNMSSLIYLNIISFEINDETNTDNAFDKLSPDLKICSNKNKMRQYLISINRNSDCDDNCFKDNADIINNELKYIFLSKNNEHNNKECFNSFYSDDINDIRIKSYNLSNKNNI